MEQQHAKLLVVDDEEVVRHSLAVYLEDSGYAVVQACDGAQALQLLSSEAFDLLLCDLRMPKMDGLTLIRTIKQTHTSLPVIVISGAGVMTDVVEALRLGACDYLIKPVHDLSMLEHAVSKALKHARLEQENERYRLELETANRELKASLRLLEDDQAAGRQLQMNILPPTPWRVGDFSFSHQITPSLYLSGDFIDYFQVDENLIAFYLADVSGHGASSAFATVLLKFMTTRLLYEFRRNSLETFAPSEVLNSINRGLINCKLGKHVTMIGGVIDLRTDTLHYSVGGHLPLPILLVDGEAVFLEGRGLPVGLFEKATYQNHSVALPKCFSLVLLSDGVLELLPGDTLKGKEASLPALVAKTEGSLDGLRSELGLAKLRDIPDDVALLVLSRNLQ
ncbi:SpoIIE family protein phosphatase [Atopomonas sediminilitoris]|uniref:SpoIIE family protein phosphatase n=1 Tax=Atopomonas sediminilitoris TaxID=2919919 RepID=UPI001F4E8B32|nr:SpoIIE family protein phosphatase [Atopomonas sediminilitoris]MCJ8170789.1 SpoIIE family protein phosphatase [Atopomonas sediminilitoris]